MDDGVILEPGDNGRGMAPMPRSDSGPQGVGLEHMDLNKVTARMIMDREQLESQETAAVDGRVMYPVNTPDQLKIMDGDILWMLRRRRAPIGGRQKETTHGAFVASSLNGIGADIARRFPGDERMQLVALKNILRAVAVAQTTKEYVNYDGNAEYLHLAAQIGGNNSSMAHVPIYPGATLKAVPPSPSSIREGNRANRPGENRTRATFELVPFDRQTFVDDFMTHMVNQIHNPQSYKAAMDPRLRVTDAWLNIGHSLRHGYLMASLLTLYGLMKGPAPVLDVHFRAGTPYDLAANPAARANMTPESLVLGLARNLGLIDESTDQIPGITPANKQLVYDPLKHDIASLHIFNGVVAQSGFGFTNRGNAAIGHDGTVMTSKAVGAMYNNQLNHASVLAEGIYEAVMRDADSGFSTSYTAADTGETFHHLQK